MSRIFLLATIFISIGIFNAQEKTLKELSLEDAVLGYYKGLYPNSMRGLKWTENNLLAIKSSDNKIEVFKPIQTKRKEKLNPLNIDSSFRYFNNWSIENTKNWSFISNNQLVKYKDGKNSF